MRKHAVVKVRTMKGAVGRSLVLAAVLGTVCQFGSCLTRGLMNAVNHAGLEFVLDNDTVFDLFADS
jgi:hypothetical protein